MRVAVWTPLPPTKSGIAHYSSMLLPALARLHDITAVVATADDAAAFERLAVGGAPFPVIAADEGVTTAGRFDLAIYQLGNNPHHEFVYEQALRRPGIVVLHEVVLHHLIVEMTLARGDAATYVEVMRRNHGQPGAAWAGGRVAGFHAEIGNFLFPASVEVASKALAVIVHNEYAKERLRSFGVGEAIEVVPHPFMESSDENETSTSLLAMRQALGAFPADRLAGVFGFVTSAKRIGIVMEAFARALSREPRLRLAIVGEPAPNIDLPAIAAAHGVERHLWSVTGYVAEEAFDRYLAAVDCVVNLRYPTAGETSGALIRTFAAGRPVAVSEYAQFAEYPSDVATPIPIGDGEVEALSRFLLGEEPQPTAKAQRLWLQEHCSLTGAAGRYAAVVASVMNGEVSGKEHPEAIDPTLPLFPDLRVSTLEARVESGRIAIRISVINAGSATIRGRDYGEVSYRLIVKLLDQGREVASQWVELPSDMEERAAADFELSLAAPAGKLTLELHHALDEIEDPLSRSWFSAEIS